MDRSPSRLIQNQPAIDMRNLTPHFICVLVISTVAFAGESCQVVPTAATLDTVPYSTATTTVVTQGTTQVEIFEYYRSVTYVSKCDDDYSTTSKVGTTTIPVFKL